MIARALLFSLICTNILFGQSKIVESNQFITKGKVKKEMKFGISELSELQSDSIKDLEITNHLGKSKGVYKNLKGILLKKILIKADIQVENPKDLSEYYFKCVATDGYKIVFSWNEIFNTDIGNHVYILTQKDSSQLIDMKERIIIISTADFMTGRRNLKGLQEIIVERVN